MNQYDYLIGTHDLKSLSDWGPFANDVYGLSHIADRKRGLKFDFFMVPGILRRKFFMPETLRECDCAMYEAAPDLSYFSIRQEMEGQDRYYTNTAYAQIAENLWLGRCEFVNETDEMRANSLLVYTRLAPRPDVIPQIPDSSCWIDALDYTKIQYSYPRPDHNLTFAGGRRGEQNYPGTVNNRCLGQPFYDRTQPCFGAKKGDWVEYEIPAPAQASAIYLRIRVDQDQSADFQIGINGEAKTFTFNGTGSFELIQIHNAPLSGTVKLKLTSAADSCGIRLDGIVIGESGLKAEDMLFAPIGRAVSPQYEAGPVANSSCYSGSGLQHSYCVWWSTPAAAEREYWIPNLQDLINYGYGLRHPYFKYYKEPGNTYCRDSYIVPINVPAHGRAVIYTLYSAGSDTTAAGAEIAAMQRDEATLEKLYCQARERAVKLDTIPGGETYQFSQRLMAATCLTNINFPISKQGVNIRHHVPDKFFNSLYSWDSGFIGLGFLELDKTRAIENLNVYVTEPDDEENAFLLYGTPMPVQAYLYAEIFNRHQDKEMLEFFYPRLRKFYNFIAGHIPTSTYRLAKSNMLRSWDYFYNSGGWDDYPPQWYLYKNKVYDAAPVVTTAHAIRFAKILSNAAKLLGCEEDLTVYNEDIQAFTDALQNYSWSEKDGVFSYVRHDENHNPAGQWMDPASGVNFNLGMDGISPLVSGICSAEQRERLFERMSDPDGMWTDIGISTVDKRAPYFRTDGYWNGCVWMPHQWFYWKAALDDNRGELARKIAMTALKTWKNEVDKSRYCFEQFSMSSHRGAGCCHFGGLSSPVLNWFGAYFAPGRLTAGFDCWILSQQTGANGFTAELTISGSDNEYCTVLYVAGAGEYQAEYNGQPVAVKQQDGCLEIRLPKNSSGILNITPAKG